MSDPLILELQLHEYLREKLLTEFLDIDEETLSDTLEGLTDLHDKLAAVIRSQQEDSVMAGALKVRIKEMQERHARFEDRVTKVSIVFASTINGAFVYMAGPRPSAAP